MADYFLVLCAFASLITAAWTATTPKCESLKSPINGLVQCSINGTVLKCTGICNTGYVFETGDDFITRTCEMGVWAGGSKLPLCVSDICMEKLLRSVNDSAITASSQWRGVKGYYFGPERARLESDVTMVQNIVQSGGWRAASNTLEQYIQVELPEVKRITGIITRGRAVLTGDTANEYVTQYRVLYSMDGKQWLPYSSETVSDQFLSGNMDNITPKTNILSCPFDAKYVRINPLTWHENIALRFDILGCKTDGSKPTCQKHSSPDSSPVMSTEIPETVSTHSMNSITPTVNLCTPIPPPVYGMMNCESQGSQLVCVANCIDGYIFASNELLIKKMCDQSTGVWVSGPGLPACIYNSNATPVPPAHNNTRGCLTAKNECGIVGNGDFHACGGCHFFATCSEGYLSVRACPESLLFDDISGLCDYHSRTCPRLDHSVIG